MQPSPPINKCIYKEKGWWFLSKFGSCEFNESKSSLWLKVNSICINTYIVWLVEVTFPWDFYDYHIVLVPFQILLTFFFSKCKERGSMPPSFPFFLLFLNITINLKMYSQYLKTNLKAWQVPMLGNVFVFFIT